MGHTADVGRRVGELLRTVREAEREIHELTGGIVDARHGALSPRAQAGAAQQAVLDALPAKIAVLDAEGVIVAVNDSWRRVGADQAEPGTAVGVGQSYLAVCDHADGASSDEAHAVAAGIRAVLGGENPTFSREYPCHGPDQARWFRLTVVPVGGGGAAAIHLDITHERYAHEALRTVEARLHAIVDNEPECVRVTSLDGLLLDINAAGLRFIEADDLAAVQGSAVIALVHPDDREAFAALHREVVAGGAGKLEFRLIGLRGTERWMETHVAPLRSLDGDVSSVVSVTRDVSAQRRADDERRELLGREQAARREADDASRYYRTLFESAPGAYLVLSPDDFAITAVSEAFLRVTSTRRDQIAGRRLFEVFPDDPTDPRADGVRNLRASLERVIATRQADGMAVQRYPIRRPVAEGGAFEERFWSTVSCSVPGPDGALAYIICRVEDVTEYIRLKQLAGDSVAARVQLDSRAEQLEADIVLRSVELKRASERQAQDSVILRISGRMARLGGWLFAVRERTVTWSDEIALIHDEAPGFSPSWVAGINYYAPEYREEITRVLRACVETGAPFDIEAQILTARGRRVWVRAIGEAVRDARGEITHVQGAFQDISEQKAAAEQIRRLGDRLLTTLESITDGFCTLDHEWRFTYLNAEAERLLERSRAGLLGRVIWEEFAEVVGGPFDRLTHGAAEEGVTTRFEEFYAPLSRWFEVEAHPARDGVAVYFRDVTERRRGREAMREGEERFRLLASATSDAVWDWNLLTDTLWWNEGFTTLFGFGLDEFALTSDSWTTRLHPADRDVVAGSVYAAIADGATTWSHEYRFRCRDGSYAYVSDRGHILRDAAGKALRMVGGMTDITARKGTEERLREQATLLDNAQDAIMVRDLDHRVLYWNRSAERLYGWTAAEVMGRSIRELLYTDSTAFLAAAAATVGQGEWVGELEQVTRSRQPLIIEGHWTLVRDERGAPRSILSINTDITGRKKLEAQFLRAQRMESIGALAGGIAHDLNNMLSPILMTVSLLQDDERDPSRRDDLASIESCALRGADMVRQLLSFARGTDGRRTKIDLRTVIDEVQKIVRDTFPKDITFRLSVVRALWEVTADPTQMHQLLTNLCVNARDAMPHGGTLTVAVEHVTIDEVFAGMNLDARPGPYVLVRLEDTGSGMPPEVLEQIFEPFFTTKELGKGTGLGLSTAHGIVRSHGGFIHVSSEVGKGTRFQVYLPANGSTDAAEQAVFEPTTLPRGRGETVLVVDDEEPIRAVAQRTLERFGYRVLLASNGAEAVSQYAMHQDEIAVVLTDMAMPVMDGPATIVALRSINPRVRIIGSSGFSTPKSVAASVQHFVPKPYTAESMLRVLRKVLSEPA